MTKRARRSREQWQSLINQFNDSTLSPTAFCEYHDLGLVSFHKWRLRFTRGERPAPTGFAQVMTKTPSMRAPADHPATLKLLLGDVRLELPADVSTPRVAELMRALAHA